MARKRERAFALFGAVLFLITSSAIAIAAGVAIYQQNQQSKTTASSTTNQTNKKDTNVTKLKGTQLANFTPIASIPKLETIDTVAGTGDEVKSGATLTVDYTGALAATGVIFESSLDSGQPATFGLDQVIKGWTLGIPGMKVGGTRRLLIPASLAYGSQGNSTIPANSDLVFDVTVHSAK